MTSSPSSAELMRLEELAKKALGCTVTPSHMPTALIEFHNAMKPTTILALVRVARCAQAVIDSGHNGNLYAKEYDALHESLQALK